MVYVSKLCGTFGMSCKKIEMRKASLSKSIGINSLRWHYPNQVMGRSEIRFLSADSIVSSPLCAIENIIATLVELDKNFLQKNSYFKISLPVRHAHGSPCYNPVSCETRFPPSRWPDLPASSVRWRSEAHRILRFVKILSSADCRQCRTQSWSGGWQKHLLRFPLHLGTSR